MSLDIATCKDIIGELCMHEPADPMNTKWECQSSTSAYIKKNYINCTQYKLNLQANALNILEDNLNNELGDIVVGTKLSTFCMY